MRARKRSLLSVSFLLAAAAIGGHGCAAREQEARHELSGGIAVLGFDDRAGRLDLAARLSDHFAARLAVGASVVLDRGQVEAVLREAGIPAADATTASGRRLLRETLGCDAIVTGLLAAFEQGSLRERPTVALSIRLVDLRSGKTICRTGGVVPRPGERPATRDGERLALAFAATLADRVSGRLGGGGETTCQ
jgi:hypothetical protein